MTNEQKLREAVSLIGRHLGPHLAISPTPRHEAIVREAARALLAALNPQEGEEPDASGGFIGDLWFGHPVKRTLATHRWNGSAWDELSSELESVLELLAKARAELAGLRASQPDAHAKLIEAFQLIADLSGHLSDEGDDWSGCGLDDMRRRVANTVPLEILPEWLHSFRTVGGDVGG